MPYCRQCHKQKPADHFELYPDHASTGPKVSLAQRRELLREGTQEGEPIHAAARSARVSEARGAYAEGEAMTARDWLALGGLVAAIGAVVLAPIALAYRLAGSGVS